jgi:hypothetical protein
MYVVKINKDGANNNYGEVIKAATMFIPLRRFENVEE